MSTTKTHTDESSDRPSLDEAQYARYDHWGEDDADTDETPDRNGHAEMKGTTKEESFPHLWLKQTAECLLDPIALNEPPENGMHEFEGQVIELSDAKEYPPTRTTHATPQTLKQKKTPSTKQWRNSEVGHIAFGGTIPDRPADELRALIEHVVANMKNVHVRQSNQEKIIERSMRMKRSGRHHDTEIMRQVATWILNPDELEDN